MERAVEAKMEARMEASMEAEKSHDCVEAKSRAEHAHHAMLDACEHGSHQELLEAVQRHMETVRLPGTVQEEERCQEKTVVFKPPMVGERLS